MRKGSAEDEDDRLAIKSLDAPNPDDERAQRHTLYMRRVVPPFSDCIIWAVALTLAQYLRYGTNFKAAFQTSTHSLVAVIALAVVAQLVTGFFLLYRWLWRIGSFEEIASLAATIAITTAVLLIWNVTFSFARIPTGTVLAGAAFTFIAAAGLRTGWRVNREYHLAGRPSAGPAIIFGAGDGGRQVIDALSGESAPFAAVGLLDDDPHKRNLQIRRLRVAGSRYDIAKLAQETGARALIIAIPTADSDTIRSLTLLSEAAGLEVRVLPPVTELFGLSVDLTDIRPVTESDLLGRHAVDTNLQSIASYLTGKRVLVTGAGGSIGSELCRQIHEFKPANLIMLDRDEGGLHQVQLSIEGRAMLDKRSLVVCDIRDVDALSSVFEEHRPEVVFHAAALKHLPLLEMWPAEAVKTNVLGTLNVLRIASQYSIERFVNISTDKAANPISVLGFSKRIAERITATIGAQSIGTYLSVRFGNVLGSRGSVLTAFKAQIEGGGPITVTHSDVMRYFMTTEEAVQLTVQAGALGEPSHVLVLDMGDPVRIVDVAERMVRHSGQDIDIAIVGLRPGEKLKEDLFADDEADARHVHPLISAVQVPELPCELLGSLEEACSNQMLKVKLQILALTPSQVNFRVSPRSIGTR